MVYIGTAGNAILFLAATVATLFVGMFTMSYAAHSFLVVLEGTANGDDDLRWPDEPMFDWLWKPWYLLWMVAFWAVPVWLLVDGVLVRLLGMPAVGFYPALVGVIWLLFPISLFSALSAGHFAIVWRLTVVRRMAKNGAALLVVYLVTGAMVVGGMALAYFALLSVSWLLVVPAAFVGATVLLWYARLQGRLAWLVSHGTFEKEARQRKKKKPRDEGPGPMTDPFAAHMPVAAPAVAGDDIPIAPPIPSADDAPADEWAPATPYVLSAPAAPQAQPKPAPVMPLDEPAQPYAVRADAPSPGAEPCGVQVRPREGKAPGEPAPLESVSEFYERRLVLKPRVPEPPPHPLWRGVYSFPWYSNSLGAWTYLSVWGTLLLILLRCVLITWPFGG